MVGNLWEWVEDWGAPTTECTDELYSGRGDWNCMAGADFTDGPAALVRGGFFSNGASAGVFAIGGYFQPSFGSFAIGFRCAR